VKGNPPFWKLPSKKGQLKKVGKKKRVKISKNKQTNKTAGWREKKEIHLFYKGLHKREASIRGARKKVKKGKGETDGGENGDEAKGKKKLWCWAM